MLALSPAASFADEANSAAEDDVVTSATAPDPDELMSEIQSEKAALTVESRCMDDYRKLRNRYAIMTGVIPVVGVAGEIESAILAFNWEYAGWTTLKAGLGSFATTAGFIVQNVIPGAVLVGLIGYESYAITKFVKTNHVYKLLKDAYGVGNGKMLRKLTKAVQKKKPELNEDEIRRLLIDADQNGNLCDRSWVAGFRGLFGSKKSMAGRVAFMKDIEAQLVK